MPKLDSFRDTLRETHADIAVVTETWLSPNAASERELEDLRERDGFDCVRRDRPGDRPAGGGGHLLQKKGDSDDGDQGPAVRVRACGSYWQTRWAEEESSGGRPISPPVVRCGCKH